jgi:hypothetical protein
MTRHHERISGAGATVIISSDRAFGFVFCVFWLIIAFFPVLSSQEIRWWALGLSATFLMLALLIPRLLHSLNRLWAKLALILHLVVSPVVLALLFFVAFGLTGWILRLFGKDLLRLRPDSNVETYWIERNPPGPSPESIVHQF